MTLEKTKTKKLGVVFMIDDNTDRRMLDSIVYTDVLQLYDQYSRFITPYWEEKLSVKDLKEWMSNGDDTGFLFIGEAVGELELYMFKVSIH